MYSFLRRRRRTGEDFHRQRVCITTLLYFTMVLRTALLAASRRLASSTAVKVCLERIECIVVVVFWANDHWTRTQTPVAARSSVESFLSCFGGRSVPFLFPHDAILRSNHRDVSIDFIMDHLPVKSHGLQDESGRRSGIFHRFTREIPDSFIVFHSLFF